MSTQPEALSDNLVLPSTAFFENTAKVIAPNPSACAAGQVVVNLGQPRQMQSLFHWDLVDASNNFVLMGSGQIEKYPMDPSVQSPATDNQLIRLQDGSLLALKNGYTWADLTPAPAWFGQHAIAQTPTSKNGRNAVYLFRSTDCGTTWTVQSIIDSAVVENGDFGWPQFNSGTGKYSVGGFDRTELYQDPWTSRIYVSGHGDGGPYSSPSVDNHSAIIFESSDNGVSWTTLRRFDDATSVPMVMTSTPRHRLIVARVLKSVPTLCFLKQDDTWSDDFDIVPVHGGQDIKLGTDGATKDVQPNTPYAPSIARVNTNGDPDRVWFAFPTLNSFGKQAYEICLVDVFEDDDPTVTHLLTVQAENPANASAILGSFVQNDMVDGPGDPLNYTLFYWIEAPATDSKLGTQLLARYQVLFGADGSFPPGHLSVTKAQKRLFARVGIGDYCSGGFFLKNDTSHFLAQWREDVIHANIVKVPPFRGPDLFMYKVADGTVDIDEIVDPNHGTVELWKKQHGWTTGWTSFVPFEMNGGRFLFMYKVGDGTVDVDQIVDPTQGTVQLWQQHHGWTTGWTSFAPFTMNGGQFVLVYKAQVGTLKVEQIGSPTQNMVTLRTDHWSTGWTHIEPFAMNGGQFLFLYKSGSGRVKVHQIVDPAQNTIELRTDVWTRGWSSIVPFQWQGAQFLFLYKQGTGTVKIHQIVAPDQDTVEVRHEKWSKGWTSVVPFIMDGRQFLFLYKSGDGTVAIVAIDDPAQGSVDIWKKVNGWTTGWTSFALLPQL